MEEAMKAAMRKILYSGATLLAVQLLAGSLAWSQDNSKPKTDTNAGTPAASEDTQPPQDKTTEWPPVPTANDENAIRALNSAKPLNGAAGPLSWGWISVRSADLRGFYNHTTFAGAGLQPLNGDNFVGMLTTSIALDRAFERFHLALQYAPTMFIAQGTVFNSMNQQLGFDTVFKLNPRWNLTLGDHFNYYSSSRVFTDLGLDVDYATGGTVQQNFLDGPGTLLFNGTDAELTYLWDPRTTVAFGPTFGYQRATGALVAGQQANALYEGGRFVVTHMLSPTKSLGLNYLGQEAQFTTKQGAVGPNGNEFLQDALVTYDQELSATWHLGLSVGVTDNSGPGAIGLGLGLAAGVAKKFNRAEFAVGYGRGHQFVGLITGQVTDRVDVVQRFYWTKRFSTDTSASYFRTVGGPASQSGFYATQQFSFQLSHSFSFIGSGSYIKQVGDGVFVAEGRRALFTMGIRWEAVPPARF
jgi:hypothetical protein